MALAIPGECRLQNSYWRSFDRRYYRLDPAHLKDINRMIKSEFVWVAEDRGNIFGVLRRRMDRLGSLFVAKSHHRQAVGRALVEKVEE